jgi:hypothetical protein
MLDSPIGSSARLQDVALELHALILEAVDDGPLLLKKPDSVDEVEWTRLHADYEAAMKDYKATVASSLVSQSVTTQDIANERKAQQAFAHARRALLAAWLGLKSRPA